MKKRIFKFKLQFEEKTELQLPKDCEILTVQLDQKDNVPYLWVLLNLENEKESRIFELFTTGQAIYYDMGIERKYIGTYQYQNGAFIGHVFERIN